MKSLSLPIAKENNPRYVYASGLIRALEARMLDSYKIELMLQARDPVECFKLLGEVGRYDEGFMHVKYPRQYYILMRDEMQKTVDLVNKLSNDPEITSLFILKYDIHNLKVLLKNELLTQKKEKLFGADIDKHMLITCGNIDCETMKELVKAQSKFLFKDYPFIDGIFQLKQQVLKSFEKIQDSESIDIACDKFLYEVMSSNIDEERYPFLKRLVEVIIDLANIRMFFRAKRFKLDKDQMPGMIFAGGAIHKSVFIEFYEQDLEAFAKRLQFTPYGDLAKNTINILHTEKGFKRLDVMCRDIYIGFLRHARYFSYSVDVLVGHLLAKEDECQKIRAIFIGKLAGIDPEEIRQTLGRTYV